MTCVRLIYVAWLALVVTVAALPSDIYIDEDLAIAIATGHYTEEGGLRHGMALAALHDTGVDLYGAAGRRKLFRLPDGRRGSGRLSWSADSTSGATSLFVWMDFDLSLRRWVSAGDSRVEMQMAPALVATVYKGFVPPAWTSLNGPRVVYEVFPSEPGTWLTLLNEERSLTSWAIPNASTPLIVAGRGKYMQLKSMSIDRAYAWTYSPRRREVFVVHAPPRELSDGYTPSSRTAVSGVTLGGATREIAKPSGRADYVALDASESLLLVRLQFEPGAVLPGGPLSAMTRGEAAEVVAARPGGAIIFDLESGKLVRQVSPVVAPRWSATGQALLAVQPDGKGIIHVDVSTGVQHTLLRVVEPSSRDRRIVEVIPFRSGYAALVTRSDANFKYDVVVIDELHRECRVLREVEARSCDIRRIGSRTF